MILVGLVNGVGRVYGCLGYNLIFGFFLVVAIMPRVLVVLISVVFFISHLAFSFLFDLFCIFCYDLWFYYF